VSTRISNIRLQKELDERFHQKLRDARAEISAEDPADQDWNRLAKMAEAYGLFMELFPEILEATPPKPPPGKK
jgi:hypothetical protein